jgi:hypothetical protein
MTHFSSMSPESVTASTQLQASTIKGFLGMVGAIAPFVSGLLLFPLAMPAQANSPASAPSDLTEMLEQIDNAASAADLDGVMAFVSPDFMSSDGLDYNDFQDALSHLWENYPGLNYNTELVSWSEEDGQLTTETETDITGYVWVQQRYVNFTSTMTSEQTFVNGQMISQTVLTEETQLTSGSNPPDVMVNLPEEVGIGEDFYFDAIVLEALGDRRLLGAALEEPVSVEGYVENPDMNFELLSAGGLFKIGQAPTTPGSQWISGILVREDGITVVTRRLNVVNP